MINSSEIQSVVRPANAKIHKRPWTQHKNPLRNKAVLFRLNPYAKTLRRQELRTWPVLLISFFFRSTDGLSCVHSASGAHQEEQGKKAEEEDSCCVAGIPVDTLRTLISRFGKAVIITRWGYGVYQCIVRYICIYTDTHARPRAMSVVTLPRRKHDVRLRDKHVCMLPCISPLFLA